MISLFLFTFAVGAIGYFLENKKTLSKIYFIVTAIVLTLIVGLRHISIGNDTASYVEIFKNSNNYIHFFEKSDTRIEYGYVLLMRLVGLLTDNYHIMLLVVAVITCFLYFRFVYKYCPIRWVGILIFMLFSMSFMMSGMRQALALAITLSSVSAICNRKLIKFLFITLVAVSMHASAICIVPLYFIVRFKNTVNMKSVVLVLAVIIVLGFDAFLNVVSMILPQYEHYFTSSYFSGQGWKGILLIFGVYVLCILLASYTRLIKVNYKTAISGNLSFGNSERHTRFAGCMNDSSNGVIMIGSNLGLGKSEIKIDKKHENLYEYTLLLSIFFYILALRANIFDRIVMYYSTYLIVLVPLYLSKYVKSKRKRMFLVLGICLILYVNILTVYLFRPGWSSVFPYRFFWF